MFNPSFLPLNSLTRRMERSRPYCCTMLYTIVMALWLAEHLYNKHFIILPYQQPMMPLLNVLFSFVSGIYAIICPLTKKIMHTLYSCKKIKLHCKIMALLSKVLCGEDLKKLIMVFPVVTFLNSLDLFH